MIFTICPVCGRQYASDAECLTTPIATNPCRHGYIQDDCQTCLAEEDEGPKLHYHVVEFINGCLNDSDSGPYESLQEAREGLQWFLDGYGDNADEHVQIEPAGEDRYERGIHILKIEACTESECLNERYD
jgi:hypothetical protein